MKTRFAVVIALALAACGGGSVDQKDLNKELVNSLCTNYAKCGLTKSAASCVDLLGVYLNSPTASSDPYAGLITAGKVKYDGSAARRCLDAYASMSCNTTLLSGGPTDCQKVYVGQVAIGQACSSIECVPDAYCSYTVDAKCPATCQSRLAAGGGPVTSSTQCQIGLIVSGNVCAKPGAEGAGCSSSTFLSTCDSGLFCEASSKTCKKNPTEGQACSSTLPCGGYNQCVNGTCAKPGDVGAACGGSSTGLACKLDLTCDTTKANPVCSDRFDEGHTCSSTSGSDCKAGLRCVSGQGTTALTCQQPGQEGAGCVSGSCDAALYCESTSKTCKKLLMGGAACTQFESCSGGFCTNNVCKNYSTTTGNACP